MSGRGYGVKNGRGYGVKNGRGYGVTRVGIELLGQLKIGSGGLWKRARNFIPPTCFFTILHFH